MTDDDHKRRRRRPHTDDRPPDRPQDGGTGDQPPKNKMFDRAPGRSPTDTSKNSIATPDEAERLERLKEEIPKLVERQRERGRAEQFLPYVIVRSVLGDRGDRPINVPFWESPDIWTAGGDPNASAAIPADPGGTVATGAANTVYAHVWNLGRAPIAGVKVEFYWFNPSLAIDAAHAHFIGMTRVDLGPRSSAECHKLVKCPKAWVPVFENGGHECLLVRVSAIGDLPTPATAWAPWADRHVAQRNISVVQTGNMLPVLLTSLANTRKREHRIQVLQIGVQGELAVKLTAPRLALDPAVQTQVLVELAPDGEVSVPRTTAQTAAAYAPIHSRSGLDQPPIETLAPFSASRMSLARLVGEGALRGGERHAVPIRRREGERAGSAVHVARHATFHEIFAVEEMLDGGRGTDVENVKPPRRGHAQIVRIASYAGDQLVGGYTIVVV